MLDVTSWFVDQLNLQTSSPKRKLLIGTSDYSSRVTRWPTVRRTLNDLRSVTLAINLDNADGNLNTFFQNTYTLPNSTSLEFGFTHPTSGDELIPMFVGNMIDVSYTREQCSIKVRDNLWDFTQRTVGASNAPVTDDALASDILWWLITSYGGLSNVQSTSNPQVDWTSFNAMAATFSQDNTTCSVRYTGEKITEAIERAAKYLQISVWAEGDGKIYFKGVTVAGSLDPVITDTIESKIDVKSQRLVNRQFVNFDYSPDSDYWQSQVFDQSTTSVNTFGLHENLIEDDSIWFTDSATALNIAQRKVLVLADPPRTFTIDTVPKQIFHQLADTFRFVDSFFNVTSNLPYQATELNFNLDSALTTWKLDSTSVFVGFYLDVSCLDGTLERLL